MKATFALIASVLALALSTHAQPKSLKEQLTGTWLLVSCERTTAKGDPQPYCVGEPNGILILDASGRYAHMIAARNRPKLPQVNRRDVPAEAFKAMAQGFLGNFGTWSVNEAEKTITRRYEGALIPNTEGRTSTMSVSLTGDQLMLKGEGNTQFADFDYGRVVTVFRRPK